MMESLLLSEGHCDVCFHKGCHGVRIITVEYTDPKTSKCAIHKVFSCQEHDDDSTVEWSLRIKSREHHQMVEAGQKGCLDFWNNPKSVQVMTTVKPETYALIPMY